MASIILHTTVHAPKEVCFNLSRDIDMHQASMKQSKETAVAGVTSGLIEQGQSVTWRATHFGVPLYMTVEIREMQAPEYFIDVMTKGPFKLLWHKHSFDSKGDYTIMTDEFIFKAPFGILGWITEQIFLKQYMKQLLQKRNKELKQTAESVK